MLDFHTVPANAQREPLEKHYVSSRSRSRKGVLVFLARDATERVLCYAHAGIPKAQQPDEVLKFVDFWRSRTGGPSRGVGVRLAVDDARPSRSVEPASVSGS